MTIIAKKINIVTLLLFTFIYMFSSISFAKEIVYHGTKCQPTNVNQANWFSWNKDGITNNFHSVGLYVLCPISVDPSDWDETPSVEIEVTMFLTPLSGYSPPLTHCVARSGIPNLNPTAADDQIFISKSFTIVLTAEEIETGGIGTASVTLDGLDNNPLRSVHLLCSVTWRGGTLMTYTGIQK